MVTLLAPYVPSCTPPDDCWVCRYHATLAQEDATALREDAEAPEQRRVFLARLKAWSRALREPNRSALRAAITRLERAWPLPKSHRRLPPWSGWKNS